MAYGSRMLLLLLSLSVVTRSAWGSPINDDLVMRASALATKMTSFCDAVRDAKASKHDADTLSLQLWNDPPSHSDDVTFANIKLYQVISTLVDAQYMLCQQILDNKDESKVGDDETKFSVKTTYLPKQSKGKVHRKVHLQPLLKNIPRGSRPISQIKSTKDAVIFIASAPGHVDRVIQQKTLRGYRPESKTYTVRRQADTLQHKKLRLAKLGTLGRLGDKPGAIAVKLEHSKSHPEKKKVQMHTKQPPKIQTCNIVPKPKNCMVSQNLNDKTPMSKQVKVKPPEVKEKVSRRSVAVAKPVLATRRSVGPGLNKQLSKKTPHVWKRTSKHKDPRTTRTIQSIQNENEAIIYVSDGRKVMTSQFTLIKKCTPRTCPFQYKRLLLDAGQTQQCFNQACSDAKKTKPSKKEPRSRKTKDQTLTQTKPTQVNMSQSDPLKKKANDDPRPTPQVRIQIPPAHQNATKVPSNKRQQAGQGNVQLNNLGEGLKPKPQKAQQLPRTAPVAAGAPKPATLKSSSGHSNSNVPPPETAFVEQDINVVQQNDAPSTILEDSEEDEDDVTGSQAEEDGEPFDEEDLGSWLRLRKWRIVFGRITKEVGTTGRLCAGALLARDMEKVDQCQDRIGMSFALSFGIAFTVAFMILASTLGTVLVTAGLLETGIRPSVSWVTSLFSKPKSYEEIEKASRALPDGYVATTERNVVAFVDSTIKTDLCVLSLSPDASTQVQKVMQRIFNMDYRITEAQTTFFQVDGIEDLSKIPEARMYAVLIESTEDKYILEDPSQGRRGVKFQTLNKLLNRGADVALIYMGDSSSRQLPKGRLYNHVLLTKNANFLIRTLCRNDRLLTINSDFTPSQTAAVHSWILNGLNVERV